MASLTTAHSETTPKRPSQQAIAFAISVVSSKPEGLSVPEYMRLLRQHISKGRRENSISSVYRHLDRSSYWRAQYEYTKVALQASEGSAVDLQREIEKLKTQLEAAKQPTSSMPTKKRKKIVDEDVIMVPRSPKKAKRESSPPRRSAGAEVEIERDFDFSDVGEIGNILMRSLFQVHAVLKSRNKFEPTVLAHYLVRTASALPQIVAQAVEASFASHSSGMDLLKTTLNAAARAANMLIVGITRLSHVSNSVEVEGQVLYAYVQMFAGFVAILEIASAAEMHKADQIESGAGDNQRPTTSKGKAKMSVPKQANLKNVPSLNATACFLCGTIDLLDAKSEVHKQLFEGLAYCILNKLGDRLYTCVFGTNRASSIADEIAASARPDTMKGQPTHLTEASQSDKDTRQAKLEAPYLIHILSRLMATAPAHLGPIVQNKKGKAKQLTPRTATKANLALHAKEKLQRTLVNCIFGTEGVEAEDPLMDCLKMPGLAGTKSLPMPKVKEVEVQEWFKEEVWRIVGWEILGQEDSW